MIGPVERRERIFGRRDDIEIPMEDEGGGEEQDSSSRHLDVYS